MRPLSILGLCVLGSCGGSPASDQQAADMAPMPDLGAAAAPDLLSGCGMCRSDQLCIDNRCSEPPTSCPCPIGSYCDLAINHCVIGCTLNDHCPLAEVCEDRHCVDHCPACDDGDACTTDACQRGVCKHAPGNDGAQCAGSSPCVQRGVCQAGACQPVPVADGTTCANATNCSSSSVCHAGTCQVVPLKDGTTCGSFQFCLAGTCRQASVLCETGQDLSANLIVHYEEYGQSLQYGGYGSCECPSSTSLDYRDRSVVTKTWPCMACAATVDINPLQLAGLNAGWNSYVCW